MNARIGFIGLGTMGNAMASRLLASGQDVTVFNRTPSRSRELVDKGASLAAAPVDVAEACDFVFSCLWDTAAVDAVYLGPHGLLEGAHPGQIFVEHATFAPSAARSVAARLAEHGAHFLDAPVTGGPEGAASGQLTAMVGGDPSALDAVAALLACYIGTVIRVGDVGRGLELKLVNQLLVTCHFAAAAEAAALIKRLDLPEELSREVLVSGWASSRMLDRSLPRVAEGSFESDGATIGGLAEIQTLVATLGDETALPQFARARASFSTGVARGRAQLDPSALVLNYSDAPTDGQAG